MWVKKTISLRAGNPPNHVAHALPNTRVHGSIYDRVQAGVGISYISMIISSGKDMTTPALPNQVTGSSNPWSAKNVAKDEEKGLPANMSANGNQQMRKLRTTTPTIRVNLIIKRTS